MDYLRAYVKNVKKYRDIKQLLTDVFASSKALFNKDCMANMVACYCLIRSHGEERGFLVDQLTECGMLFYLYKLIFFIFVLIFFIFKLIFIILYS